MGLVEVTVVTTRTSLHAAWTRAFRNHIACLHERRLISNSDQEAVAAWEAREAELGELVDAAGIALDAHDKVAA